MGCDSQFDQPIRIFTESNRPDPAHETTAFPRFAGMRIDNSGLRIVGYKIRRKSDGKYSTGGSTPEFTSVGKTWSNRSGLHSHFACIQEYRQYAMRRHRGDPIPDFVTETYVGCEVVTLIESGHIDIASYREKIKHERENLPRRK